ncbi:hypothetical protein, unlikely [Trypanosoma brucei gambiense DAL972]|uniref:Uncharacterized protein n=1 Tax=Trypanosoma brucei gambiense (strain MHOM/CI/86/DAL972) TaxID=679716 RepID=C9ZQ61_TRYB9|nr:hypothetical protein, unlikely [Trypanosoma brucei gambiense DAL972]CBH11541.1 hypothetical protein, unlikely [Trypanosoma brucei gambiense DAL972]|eukprot:XP_011773826.1 hypothetical protein, unlikely [Trypanosoma brucei gambiense DAL972]
MTGPAAAAVWDAKSVRGTKKRPIRLLLFFSVFFSNLCVVKLYAYPKRLPTSLSLPRGRASLRSTKASTTSPTGSTWSDCWRKPTPTVVGVVVCIWPRSGAPEHLCVKFLHRKAATRFIKCSHPSGHNIGKGGITPV